MRDSILQKYKTKRVLAVYFGEDAWKKLVPIRWPQTRVRASVRRRFKNVDMSNSMLVIFVSPKTGAPKEIGIHFYPDENNSDSNMDVESDDLWIIETPFYAVELEDAPKLLKKLVGELS